MAVSVVTRGSEEAIEAAALEVDGTSALTDADGVATLTALRGATVSVSAEGHDASEATVPDEGDLVVELRPNVVSGNVTDAEGAPVAGVRVFVDGEQRMVETDEDGAYALTEVPEGATVIYKMPGYRLHEMGVTDGVTADVALEPFEARALYAPAAIFEAPGRLDEMLALLDRTEANAMVIDVKETDGRLYWATDLETAAEVGAIRETPVFDLEELLPALKERGIYTIARMVSMKDNTSAAARPEMAVRNSATGEPWRDNIGGAWLDPSAPGVAEYLASIAGDLADKGFDEVQLDYIRFFSDGPYDVADTNLPNTQSFRLPAIQRVLRVVSSELETTRTFLGADVFPDRLHRPGRPGHRAASGGDHAVRGLLLSDGLSVPLRPGRVRPPGAEHRAVRRDRQDARAHERGEGRAAGRDSAVDPGLRIRLVPAVHRRPDPRGEAGAHRQRRQGLDDLECPGDLHRGRARSAARGRGFRPRHRRAIRTRALGIGRAIVNPVVLPVGRCGSLSSA